MAPPPNPTTRIGGVPALRILIVEDDDELREAIALDAESWPVRHRGASGEILTAATADEGIALLEREPEFVLVDVRLGDDSGIRVVKAANQKPQPPGCLAMSGQASAEEAFELARLGVRGYLAKPFSLGELRDIIEQAVNAAPQLEEVAQAEVGHTPILTVQDRVKKAMLLQALEIWDGNYVKTARSLGVTRQAVQQMVKRYDVER